MIQADVNITVFSTNRLCWYATWEADPLGLPGSTEASFTKDGVVRRARRQIQRSVNRRAQNVDSRTRKEKTTEFHVVRIDVTKLREAEANGR